MLGFAIYLALIFALEHIQVSGLDSLEMCDAGSCQAGQFYDLPAHQCVACPPGTFIDQENHHCEECKPCSKGNVYNDQVELDNCTLTSDTKLGCRTGYYVVLRDDWPDPNCFPCDLCETSQRMEKPCGLNFNTVCVDLGLNKSEKVGFAGGDVLVTPDGEVNHTEGSGQRLDGSDKVGYSDLEEESNGTTDGNIQQYSLGDSTSGMSLIIIIAVVILLTVIAYFIVLGLSRLLRKKPHVVGDPQKPLDVTSSQTDELISSREALVAADGLELVQMESTALRGGGAEQIVNVETAFRKE